MTTLALLLTLQRCKGQTTSDVQNLYLNFLQASNYISTVRPSLDQNKPTEIVFDFDLFTITKTDELTGWLSLEVGVYTEWYDHRIEWEPVNFGGVSEIYLPMNKMWKPEFVFKDSMGKIDSFGIANTQIKYTSTGTAHLYLFDVINVHCEFNVNKFPFDVNVCKFNAVPITYTGTEMVILNLQNVANMDLFNINDKWIITKTLVEVWSDQDINLVHFEITLNRRWQYFVLIQISPVLVLSILNNMVFKLHVNSGERAGYSITCLLSFAVFLQEITSHFPKSSKNMPFVSYYLTSLILHSGLICIVTIVNLTIYNQENTTPIPGWLRRCIGCVQTPRMCMTSSTSTGVTQTVKNIRVTPFIQNSETHEDIKRVSPRLNTGNANAGLRSTPLSDASTNNSFVPIHNNVNSTNNETQQQQSRDQYTQQPRVVTWKSVASVLDRLMFVVSMLVTFLTTTGVLLSIIT